MKRGKETENGEKFEISAKRVKPPDQDLENIKFEPGKWLIHLSTPGNFFIKKNFDIYQLVFKLNLIQF